MKDQMTDIQRSLQDLRLAVENLTQQQQQEDEEDHELQDDAPNARGAPHGNRPRGFTTRNVLTCDPSFLSLNRHYIQYMTFL
jgi:hypothetical protein